ncbi:outer membrane protein assembly factor BamA [Croceicoccus estronivorus]|uniref:outer membrane protein assembly factor BamA n=1 Tax=Croceicoccus estronivorus TaxID=1172626 RepID=UPI0008302752|nr:outer membrane protein assembly factor BamA [Croceicoccus estronivorus]OCC25096.1 outer membrane protein assembly factor BamA [Croceicoccus estronivorus]
MSRMGNTYSASRLAVALLGGTILGGLPSIALAQEAQEPTAAETEAVPPAVETIKSITVVGSQRLEPETILSYIQLRQGDVYTQAAADQALKDLYATELLADVSIRNEDGNVVIQVQENPIINRIILEGNKRIKDDKILPEIKMAPRQIFTRSKVRADVARIIELYKRKGRFAAKVEPKMVQLEQNRVDIVYEISEGPKSKVRKINIIGNEEFSDGELRSEMVTKQARFFRLFSSNTGYDPDRLAFDQQKLRQFYLTEGYADFRVVSAVAELTPDKKDFIITYVVEEGDRYKFGDVEVESQLRDFDSGELTAKLPMKQGDWYNAKEVEDTVEQLSEAAGTMGYAFADVRPNFRRSKDDRTMSVTFTLAEAPRVYVEKVNINGNTLTQDKVIRREFRIAEGDAFDSLKIKRTTNRIKSLGYFQENFEVEQKEGSAPDRIVLEANVEEKPTGELQLSAGFSSLESFILSGSIRQRNFRGRGQTVGLSVNFSRYTRAAQVSFVEPYLFDRNISAGVDIYRRDYNSYNYLGSKRNTTYERSTTGIQMRLGVPLTEYISAIGRYTLNYDDVSLDKQYFADLDGDGQTECSPLLAGRYLCDALGKDLSSILGLSVVYDTRDSRYRPTRGHNVTVGVDFAGLGGDVRYARITGEASKYWSVGGGFIFSLSAEGGFIKALNNRGGDGVDDLRITDRFFLGEPQIRGFDIRGIGPRVLRKPLMDLNGCGADDATCTPAIGPNPSRNSWTDDALGGRAYYIGRAELEIPLGSGAREMGLRPSIFVDAGAVWGITKPKLTDTTDQFDTGIFIPARDTDGNPLYTQVDAAELVDGVCTVTDTSIVTNDVNPNPPACLGSANNSPYGSTIPAFKEYFVGNTPKPRVSVGIGVNWNSPFGPLRIDFAKVLLKVEGDDTKAFSFNVGTQF